MPTLPERKAFWLDFKDAKVADSGIIEGYLTRFGEEDLEGDIVEKGAFKKTLKEKGDKRPFLWQHFYNEPIGVLTAREDDVGLYIAAQLNLDVQRAKEAFTLIKQGAVKGLSQGFVAVKFEARRDKEGRGRVFQEIDLWEGSAATFPALPTAEIIAVRSAWPPYGNVVDAEDVRAAEERMAGVAGETLKRLQARRTG